MSLQSILMKRDNISKLEADEMIRETKECIEQCFENCREDEIELVMLEHLGLEMDYIDELI